MEKYTYLLLNLFTISIPLALSFEHKVAFSKKWKHLFPSIFSTAVFFLIWDYYKTKYGVWEFNSDFIVGIRFWGLPLEEYLFFITVPYSCLFIYEVLNYYITKSFLPAHFNQFLFALAALAFLLSFPMLNKTYTWSVLFGTAILLPMLLQQLKSLQLQNFLLMFLISIVPMLLVNGVLTALPVVSYNNAENMGWRFTTMPVEDLLYNLIMLGMNVVIFERLRKRNYSKAASQNLPVVQFF